jgi:hypothetical protein
VYYGIQRAVAEPITGVPALYCMGKEEESRMGDRKAYQQELDSPLTARAGIPKLFSRSVVGGVPTFI